MPQINFACVKVKGPGIFMTDPLRKVNISNELDRVHKDWLLDDIAKVLNINVQHLAIIAMCKGDDMNASVLPGKDGYFTLEELEKADYDNRLSICVNKFYFKELYPEKECYDRTPLRISQTMLASPAYSAQSPQVAQPSESAYPGIRLLATASLTAVGFFKGGLLGAAAGFVLSIAPEIIEDCRKPSK